MTRPELLSQVEEALGYQFPNVRDIHAYFNDPEVYPDSYREVMTEGEEMLRDANGGTVFGNKEGHLLGINLYGLKDDLDPDKIQDMLALYLPHLQVLNLNETGVTTFAFSHRQPNLQHVNLSQNESLTEIFFEKDAEGKPFSPSSLVSLHCYDSRVSALNFPAAMPCFVKLDIARNKVLESLTFGGAVPSLWYVDAAENGLTTLEIPGDPEKGLRDLMYVYLRKNQLISLELVPFTPKLDLLDIRENQLDALPRNLVRAEKSLNAIHAYGNPLKSLPPELISSDERGNSVEAIMSYLVEAEKGTEVNNRAKLILVGNGRVGKTSMYRRIKDEPFNKNEPYTHGVQLEKLDKTAIPEIKTDSLQLNVWDFGGQEIFYATHQFFLTDDALYILAWTDVANVKSHRERDLDKLPFDEVWRSEEYWLENIRLHGKTSPILMVQTHTDQNETAVNSEFLKDPFNAQFLNFSASKDYGLPRLKNLIAKKLNQELSFFGQEFPKTYSRVISDIELLKSNDRHTISKTEFNNIARSAGISDGGEDDLLTYLNKTGVVVYLGDRETPLLKNTIYIDPNWLTQQVYCLINNDLRDLNGEITSGYLRKAFPQKSNQECQEILDLLVGFELIFKDSREEDLYISPQYLPDKPPRDTKIFIDSLEDELGLAFVFRFPRFVPENVMINFLCRYGPDSNKVFWKNGIYFSNIGVKVLVIYQDHSLTVKMSFVVEKSSYKEYWRVRCQICQAFVELSRNANAEISLDGEHFVSYQELERQAKIGNPYIETITGGSLPVEPFLELLKEDYSHLRKDESPEAPLRKKPQPMNNLQKLIQANEIDRAFDLMGSHLDDDEKNTLILLRSRWNSNESLKRAGTISQEHYGLERNRILSSLNHLASEYLQVEVPGVLVDPTPPAPAPPKPSRKIYFSYAWKDDNPEGEKTQQLIQHLLSSLKEDGVPVIRDKEDLGYGESIGSFMQDVGKAPLVVVFTSPQYFKSPNCMYELTEIGRNSTWNQDMFRTRILHVALDFVNFSRPKVLKAYVAHWNSEEEEWKEFFQENDSGTYIEQNKLYRRIIDINRYLGELGAWLNDINSASLKLHTKDDFALIKETIKKRLNDLDG